MPWIVTCHETLIYFDAANLRRIVFLVHNHKLYRSQWSSNQPLEQKLAAFSTASAQ
jgi:hypothetical protein